MLGSSGVGGVVVSAVPGRRVGPAAAASLSNPASVDAAADVTVSRMPPSCSGTTTVVCDNDVCGPVRRT